MSTPDSPASIASFFSGGQGGVTILPGAEEAAEVHKGRPVGGDAHPAVLCGEVLRVEVCVCARARGGAQGWKLEWGEQ